MSIEVDGWRRVQKTDDSYRDDPADVFSAYDEFADELEDTLSAYQIDVGQEDWRLRMFNRDELYSGDANLFPDSVEEAVSALDRGYEIAGGKFQFDISHEGIDAEVIYPDGGRNEGWMKARTSVDSSVDDEVMTAVEDTVETCFPDTYTGWTATTRLGWLLGF